MPLIDRWLLLGVQITEERRMRNDYQREMMGPEKLSEEQKNDVRQLHESLTRIEVQLSQVSGWCPSYEQSGTEKSRTERSNRQDSRKGKNRNHAWLLHERQ